LGLINLSPIIRQNITLDGGRDKVMTKTSRNKIKSTLALNRQSLFKPLGSKPFPPKASFTSSNNVSAATLSALLSGFLFGFSLAFSLGLNLLSSVTFAVLVALGVLLSKSLISYLVLQTIAFAALSGVSQIVFRVNADFVVKPETFQISYLLVALCVPLLSFIPAVKKATSSLEPSANGQLIASITFTIFVLFLRSRLPSEPTYALSKMYYGEDNAGVIEVLAKSLQLGYASHVGLFGEFMNGAYLAAAGLISWFGDLQGLGLLAAITHYNITLLLMALSPIAAFSAITLSGRKHSLRVSTVAFTVVTLSTAFLFWPFTNIGHTSVISSGLFAMPLFAITLNRKLATDHPLFFATIVSSLSLIVGTTWFPLMPFAASIVVLTFAALLHVSYSKGNTRTVIGFVAFSALLMLTQLPSILGLVFQSGGYLALEGGTRRPEIITAVFWILLALFVILKFARGIENQDFLGKRLFAATLVLLLASNAFILVSGLLANSGSFGYGAKKYFLTSIAFSLPLIWFVLIKEKTKSQLQPILFSATTGLALLLSILAAQVDTRQVAVSVLSETETSFLRSPSTEDLAKASAGVKGTMKIALEQNPDHIFCVSDYGFPLEDSKISLDSYFCSRWAGSLSADAGTFGDWRFVPLGQAPVESLQKILDINRNKDVVVIRLLRPEGSSAREIPKSETWWIPYVDDSWRVIPVP
jgi:hypothetical protein